MFLQSLIFLIAVLYICGGGGCLTTFFHFPKEKKKWDKMGHNDRTKNLMKNIKSFMSFWYLLLNNITSYNPFL